MPPPYLYDHPAGPSSTQEPRASYDRGMPPQGVANVAQAPATAQSGARSYQPQQQQQQGYAGVDRAANVGSSKQQLQPQTWQDVPRQPPYAPDWHAGYPQPAAATASAWGQHHPANRQGLSSAQANAVADGRLLAPQASSALTTAPASPGAGYAQAGQHVSNSGRSKGAIPTRELEPPAGLGASYGDSRDSTVLGGGQPTSGSGVSPFGTDLTLQEMMERTRELEDLLMKQCQEKDALESEYSKMPLHGGRTLKDRQRKAAVEDRIEVLHKEISTTRLQLKRLLGK